MSLVLYDVEQTGHIWRRTFLANGQVAFVGRHAVEAKCGIARRIRSAGSFADPTLAMKLLRALIVDPDRSACSVMARLLDSRSFDTVEAVDIVGALGFALGGAIDLIIADIDFDELEGLQLLRIIRSGCFGKSPPPVIVCSAILNEEVWIGHPALKGVTRLQKPFTPSAFITALDLALPAG